MKQQFIILGNAVLAMKKYNVYLRSFSKILLNNKIKQTVFFYEMNLISDLYHRKIEQKLYTDS